MDFSAYFIEHRSQTGSDYSYNCSKGRAIYTRDLSRLISVPEDKDLIETRDGVSIIGSIAFGGCDHLASIKIPNSMTKIGYDAFYDCPRLSLIELPYSVTEIDCGALDGCTGLIELHLRHKELIE